FPHSCPKLRRRSGSRGDGTHSPRGAAGGLPTRVPRFGVGAGRYRWPAGSHVVAQRQADLDVGASGSDAILRHLAHHWLAAGCRVSLEHSLPEVVLSDMLDRLRTALAPRYQLERELAGGAMSRVFVATESGLGRQVVIKVLPPDLGATLSVDRFRREIQLAASLQHPHIVPLLAAGEAGDLLFFTMPFIDGETLRARLARDGRL